MLSLAWCMMATHEDVVVVVQDELQNHCRSRETCSFGTPDAVVCKAARSASAVLAAVGRSVGIGARAGAGFVVYGGPVRECYAAPLFVVMLPPLLRGLMVRYDGC